LEKILIKRFFFEPFFERDFILFKFTCLLRALSAYNTHFYAIHIYVS